MTEGHGRPRNGEGGSAGGDAGHPGDADARRPGLSRGPRPPGSAPHGAGPGPASRAPGRTPGAAGRPDELGALLTLVARGDHGAYEAIFDRTAGQVLGTVLAVVRDPAQSEEGAQEVLLDVWRSASRFDPALGSAAAWMMTLAHRRAVDRVRAEQKAAEREMRAASSSIAYDEVTEAVDVRLDRERVRRCLGSLTELQRESVTLAYYGGYTHPGGAGALRGAGGPPQDPNRRGPVLFRARPVDRRCGDT